MCVFGVSSNCCDYVSDSRRLCLRIIIIIIQSLSTISFLFVYIPVMLTSSDVADMWSQNFVSMTGVISGTHSVFVSSRVKVLTCSVL